MFYMKCYMKAHPEVHVELHKSFPISDSQSFLMGTADLKKNVVLNFQSYFECTQPDIFSDFSIINLPSIIYQ